jgi:outer membrane protein
MRLLTVLLFLSPVVAGAGEWLDNLRGYDLNDYALGLTVTGTQNPYVGGENSTYAYPYLTSFTHPSLTDNLVLLRNGEVGLRRITDSGWEFWVAGRMRTLGFGNSDSDTLRGVEAPKWNVELGPGIGYRRWPVQIHLNAWAEPTDRHSGVAGSLALSYPVQFARGYVVPEISARYEDASYADYYYGVSAEEALPERPEYSPGALINTKLRVSWGYELSSSWLLTGKLGYEVLADEVRRSPLVGRDHILSASLGLAYTPAVFRSGSLDTGAPAEQRFDFRFGLFNTRVDSKVGRFTSGGVPGEEVDLEDVFGQSENENVLQLDAFWRFNRYHRIEAGFFELVRNGSITIEDELRFGDDTHTPGSTVNSRSHFKSIRIGYAYALVRDQQKELGLMAGIHFSSFDAIISSPDNDLTEESRLDAPLPVIGVHASVNLSAALTIAARAQIFRTDYDAYEGSLNYLSFEVRKQFGKQINAGLGFNYYRMKLRSSDTDLNGFVDIQHYGPVVFLGYEF